MRPVRPAAICRYPPKASVAPNGDQSPIWPLGRRRGWERRHNPGTPLAGPATGGSAAGLWRGCHRRGRPDPRLSRSFGPNRADRQRLGLESNRRRSPSGPSGPTDLCRPPGKERSRLDHARIRRGTGWGQLWRAASPSARLPCRRQRHCSSTSGAARRRAHSRRHRRWRAIGLRRVCQTSSRP